MPLVTPLGSYQTSWAMLHRFRRAMVRPGRERLHGKVEVDETYVGIRDPSKLLNTRCSPKAFTPYFWLVRYQAAANQTPSGVRVLSNTVPALTVH